MDKFMFCSVPQVLEMHREEKVVITKHKGKKTQKKPPKNLQRPQFTLSQSLYLDLRSPK